MNPITAWLKLRLVLIIAICSRIQHPAAGQVPSIEPPQSASCLAPEYRQFDFWVGDWDAFEVDGSTKVARIRVDRVLDGCALREDYEGADGLKGQSYSIYDASRKVWHQSWVTNRGQLLIIEGKMQAGEMILSGVDHTTSGEERHVRGTWKTANGGARETAVISTDGGKSWRLWFDLLFRPHTP